MVPWPWSDWVPNQNDIMVIRCWSGHVFPNLNWIQIEVLHHYLDERMTMNPHIYTVWTCTCFSHPSLTSHSCSHASQPHISRIILYMYTKYEFFKTYRCEFNCYSVTRDLCYSTPATMPPLSSNPSHTSIPCTICKPLQKSCRLLLPTMLGTIVASVPAANPADGYHGPPISAPRSSIAPGHDQQNAFLKTAYAHCSSDQFHNQASHI